MQDCVLNLCRVKLRDQLRLEVSAIWKNIPNIPTALLLTWCPGRKCGRRRATGLGAQVQRLGKGSERVHLFHDPGARLAPTCEALGSRSGSMIQPILRHAHGSPTFSKSCRNREADCQQDQVRSHRHVRTTAFHAHRC